MSKQLLNTFNGFLKTVILLYNYTLTFVQCVETEFVNFFFINLALI